MCEGVIAVLIIALVFWGIYLLIDADTYFDVFKDDDDDDDNYPGFQ